MRKQEAAETYPRTREAWRKWLAKNHKAMHGVWVIYDKASTGRQQLTYADAVEEALCFGWIDSTVNAIDEERYRQYFTPRKPTSVWSAPNKKRVARLTAEGAMHESGLKCIEVARLNGSWETLDAVEALVVPPDLLLALAREPDADRNFAGMSPSARKAYLYWVNGAKGEQTRAKRIASVTSLAARNVKSRFDEKPPEKRNQ